MNKNQQKAIIEKIHYYDKVCDSVESIEEYIDHYEFLNEILPPLRGIYENFIRDLKYIASLSDITESDDIDSIIPESVKRTASDYEKGFKEGWNQAKSMQIKGGRNPQKSDEG